MNSKNKSSEELKLVIKRSNPYEKLDFIDNNINDIIPVIEKTDIDYKDIILQKLRRIQDILDRHHGLLLYAKKNHGFDLTKILNDWYSDQNWEGHEIMKAYNGPDEND